MILAHLTHELRALKTCSLTCRSWYAVAVIHLHHTLTLGNGPYLTRGRLKPLSKLHGLGLIPLVKEIRVKQPPGADAWFVPREFNRRDLRYFTAFANVQTLAVQSFQIYHFIPGIERYFGHFSPMVRSIVLSSLQCTPRQLLYFLSLFPNLDNIEIRHALPFTHTPDTGLIPFTTPSLRGRLVLHHFGWVETWTDLATLCGGLRFSYVDMYGSVRCAPVLLDGCAETLETLRLNTTNDLGSK